MSHFKKNETGYHNSAVKILAGWVNGMTEIPFYIDGSIVFVPDVASLIETASAWLAPFKSHAGIVAWEGEDRQGLLSLRRELPQCQAVWLTIGPEGGFSEAEVELFQQAQFYILRLGPRILRFETAATSLIAAAQLLWGDLG